MATYLISLATKRGFDVKIVGDDGVRQTMLGFPTRAAADAWIAEDQQWSHMEAQKTRRAPRQS
jgi:uncharacterized protein YmfQ (DUF2313 family)